ncbi:MAG: hypothetical protein IJC71_04400 [Clostridia bacterium]|nr:hypothetical protein [Clostridia bacterium]
MPEKRTETKNRPYRELSAADTGGVFWFSAGLGLPAVLRGGIIPALNSGFTLVPVSLWKNFS